MLKQLTNDTMKMRLAYARQADDEMRFSRERNQQLRDVLHELMMDAARQTHDKPEDFMIEAPGANRSVTVTVTGRFVSKKERRRRPHDKIEGQKFRLEVNDEITGDTIDESGADSDLDAMLDWWLLNADGPESLLDEMWWHNIDDITLTHCKRTAVIEN